MRHLLLAASLLAAPALAVPQQPDAQRGVGVSAAGPIVAAGSKRSTATASRALASSTYTYLRCWYRVSTDPLKPAANYEWARDPVSDDWYRVNGNWWSSVSWKNMFYSDVSQQTLQSVCEKTLAAKGIQRPLLSVFAADNQFSYNYSVWSNDSAQQDGRFNKVIALGDSLSDTQNMYNASQWKLPNGNSWMLGRFSNDRVWVEYLAQRLSLPLYNWAIGGSAADSYMVVPGLKQQVQSWREYMQQAPAYRAENTLFTVLIGGNDLVNYNRTPDDIIASNRESLNNLIAGGARHIVLLNLPDVSRAPVFKLRSDGAKVGAQVRDYNQKLTALVAELQARYGSTLQLKLFDAYSVFDDLLTNPANYGIANTSDSCLKIDSPTSLTYTQTQTPRSGCRDPSRYVFWDTLHPTTRSHQLLAEKVDAFVKANFASRLPALR